jgi:glycerophosphoryl diester phosphodiesterase
MTMHVPYYVERALMSITDLYFMLMPRKRPTRQALLDSKIVSHRGEHDNRRVRENTLAAFTPVAAAGCWGIEFDLRWTRDLEPVVMHDADARRVFGVDLVIAEASLSELQQRIPEIPTLREVVERFGGRQHLMVELKADDLGARDERGARLGEIFAGLEAGVDYHFLALQLELFEMVGFAGKRACVPVAELNLGEFSVAALEREFDGVSAQYLLLGRSIIQRHHRQGQKLGTGFAASRRSFYREVNRGVDWIFSNHALKLEAIRQELLRRG